VLVQGRKSSKYLLNRLVPALRPHCRVKVLDSYVEDLVGLFNRSRVYLYDSAEYWAINGLTEGFGLPPLEALACGCTVFSSVNSALADYLDPGFNCQKIGAYSTQYDGERILNYARNYPVNSLSDRFFDDYHPEKLIPRFEVILKEINDFFDIKKRYRGDIEGLPSLRIKKLWLQSSFSKLKKKLFKGNGK
jgi:glycosyltransferase involved in cell wall biosynthesis